MTHKSAVFFCVELPKDPVSSRAWNHFLETYPSQPTDWSFEGLQPRIYKPNDNHNVVCVPTREVVSHDLGRFLTVFDAHLADCDYCAIANWHEGASAPDAILCAHTNGDVACGCFPPTDPWALSRILWGLRRSAIQNGLTDWQVLPEATHFSGTVYGVDPDMLIRIGKPLIDVEIGSTEASWSNPKAISALVDGLLHAQTERTQAEHAIIYVGGTHFDPSLACAVVGEDLNHAKCAVGHVLPNQWLGADYSGDEGERMFRAVADATKPHASMFVFHDNLKGPIKAAVRAAAEALGLLSGNHRVLRNPSPQGFWK